MEDFELDPNMALGHSGKLELLYSRALQRSKAALDAEALERLARSESLESSVTSDPSLPALETLGTLDDRRALYDSRMDDGRNREAELHMDVLGFPPREPPIDFFTHVNPDCFNVDGRPVGKPRWHPLRAGDARRRPHVPLHQDFDSPSESEASEEEEEHVDEEVKKFMMETKKVPFYSRRSQGKSGLKHFEAQSFGAAAEMQMGQFQLQERPSETPLALPAPEKCPCLGPHCCVDHCKNLAGHCSTLLEGLRHWRGEKVVVKASKPRGPYKLRDEDSTVEELRVIREQQLNSGTLEQNRLAARQRAS